MVIVLYIQVKAQEHLKFGNPWSTFFKENQPETVILDADNHSDDLVIEQELKMLKEADFCYLLLDAEPTAKPGKAIKLIEAVIRGKQLKSLIHIQGENPIIEKMLNLSKAVYHQNLTNDALEQLLDNRRS